MKTTETKSAKHLLGAFVQKAGKRLRKDIDLVHVIWGPDDQGVISLKLGTWLFYNFGREFGGHHSRLPTVYIEDADFALVLKPVEGDPDCIEATWDDVARLLNHPRFPLVKRIEWPVVEKCKRCGANLTGTQDPENPPNNRPYGLCSDPTCPYNDRSQEATWTEG